MATSRGRVTCWGLLGLGCLSWRWRTVSRRAHGGPLRDRAYWSGAPMGPGFPGGGTLEELPGRINRDYAELYFGGAPGKVVNINQGKRSNGSRA